MNKNLLSMELKEYANKLKENKFKVYFPEIENPNFCYFVKEDKLGYVENTQHGFNFISVHKPTYANGTGYSIHREVFEPTIKHANDTFINRPIWASVNDDIKKYLNWENFIKTSIYNITFKFKEF